MSEMLEPTVVSRRGNTTHEDTGTQANRVSECVWQTLVKQRQQRVIPRADPVHHPLAVPTYEPKGDSVSLLPRDTLCSNWTRFTASLEVPEVISSLQQRYEESAIAWKASTAESFTRATGETSTLVSWLQSNRQAKTREEELDADWTEEKNGRRCALVDREIDGTISFVEKAELEKLQSEMLDYRRSIAPLPLEALRELHQALLCKANKKDNLMP